MDAWTDDHSSDDGWSSEEEWCGEEENSAEADGWYTEEEWTDEELDLEASRQTPVPPPLVNLQFQCHG